jgi:hypothetical protein
MLFIPYKGTMLHMARNIFRIDEVVRTVILSNFFVEAMKSTAFNGSNFFKDSQSDFLLVRTRVVYRYVVRSTSVRSNLCDRLVRKLAGRRMIFPSGVVCHRKCPTSPR